MTHSAADSTGQPARPSRMILRGVRIGLFLCLALMLINSFVANNLHVVVPGQIYRASQMSGPSLERVIQHLGIRTVINLRGPCLDLPWYRDECRVTSRLDVSQEDICFSAGHLPPVDEVHRLIEVLDRSEYPILFHCFRGVDRTGLATTLVLLLKTETPLAEARHSLSPRYVHLHFGRTGHLDQFLDLYERWLQEQGMEHSQAHCRDWLLHGYRGDRCNARLELLGLILPGHGVVQPVEVSNDAAPEPNGKRKLRVPRDVPIGVRVRCHNTSDQPWDFHPSDNAGIHAYWRLMDNKNMLLLCGRAGRFHTRVSPGGHLDLTLAVPPLKWAGIHHLEVSMIDEQHCFFHEVAMELLALELEVP